MPVSIETLVKKSFQIRDLTVGPPLVLAPMSGVTCSAFRRLIKRLNPGYVGLVVTEFLSVEGMTRDSRRTLEMMRFRDEERPLSIQIFGKDPSRMRDAALMIQDSGADIVDINCACPAPKVVRKGGGCELMRQPLLLGEILREVRKNVSIPLTMKMRAGWDSSSISAVEIAKLAEGEGVEALAVHGRTRAQMYRGESDWNLVEQVARSVSIPVCGSGDITDKAGAEGRFSDSIAGLYIGRAALANPYIFTEICTDESKNIREIPRLALDVVAQYMNLLSEDLPEKAVLGRIKQMVCRMARKKWGWKTDLLRKNRMSEVVEVICRASADCRDTEIIPHRVVDN